VLRDIHEDLPSVVLPKLCGSVADNLVGILGHLG